MFQILHQGSQSVAITELFIVIIIIFFVKVMSDEGMTTSESNVRQHRPINLKRSCVKLDRQLLWLEVEMRQTRSGMTRLVAKIAKLRSIDFYGRLWIAIGRNDCKLLATTNIKSANNEINFGNCAKNKNKLFVLLLGILFTKCILFLKALACFCSQSSALPSFDAPSITNSMNDLLEIPTTHVEAMSFA